MSTSKINTMLIPNVSRMGTEKKADVRQQLETHSQNDFSNLLENELKNSSSSAASSNVNNDVTLSTHAARRLQERGMELDAEEFTKLKNAMTALKNKGGQDSLIITGKGAYIVDVTNNKIVTALDRNNMAQNVFTKIDSTVILN